MYLTTQHLIILGIRATEGEALAAAYHWSVQQVTYMNNINAAREDHTKVTEILKDCNAALATNAIMNEEQIIEDLYVITYRATRTDWRLP